MNSHNPYSQDELGKTIRDTLKAKTDQATPSNRVWREIQKELKFTRPLSMRFTDFLNGYAIHIRSWLVVPVALMFCLLLVGSLDLDQSIQSISGNPTSTIYVPVLREAPINIENGGSIYSLLDEDQLRSLNIEVKASPIPINPHQIESPILIAFNDVPPAANSPEGRWLAAKLSRPPIVVTQIAGIPE